jgi:hypothetical protein
MTPVHRTTNIRLETELLEGLHDVKYRDGIPVNEQIRRAVIAWLRHKNITVTAVPKRIHARLADASSVLGTEDGR